MTIGINKFRLRGFKNGNLVYSNVLSYTKQVMPTVIEISYSVLNNNMLNVCINVSSDGGSPILECGFVYNTAGNPTIADNKVLYNNQLGRQCNDFIRPVVGQKYYFAAFVTTAVGTSYIHYPILI